MLNSVLKFPTFGWLDGNANTRSIDEGHEYNNISVDQAKKDFIAKYGIELQMPATYIFSAFIYKPDPMYIISACCQIFPQDLEFYDYNKLLTGEEVLANEAIEQQKQLSGKLMLKVYSQEGEKYQLKKVRLCDSTYLNMVCFSNDNRRVALFRKMDKNENKLDKYLKKPKHFVIDIFDCSQADFFLNDSVLTFEDPSLVATIKDTELNYIKKVDDIFLRFSSNTKYLYLTLERKQILVYDVSQVHSQITKHKIATKLPSQYSDIIEISIDEDNLSESLVAVKKSEFRNIDVVRLGFLTDIQDKLEKEMKSLLSTQEFAQLQTNYLLVSIRIGIYDYKQTHIKFSQDHSKCIYCDTEQNLIIEFSSSKHFQKIKQINHLQGKQCRALERYEESDFMIATADPQDNEISIRHSSNPNKKVKFYIRYSEGPVVLRDIYCEGKTQNILLTRDDEEFIVYKFQDFDNKPSFWQRFYESSNYLFEWPYICYINGKNQVMVQNTFQPKKAVVVSIQGIKENFFISNIFVSEAYNLYIMIETQNQYLIYERDLDPCVEVFLKNSQATLIEKLNKQSYFKHKLTQMSVDIPMAVIDKQNINRKPIYKFYVRSSTQKELIQTDAESIILFFCDFKIYQIINGEQSLVDNGYKFKMLNHNILAYQTVDENNKKTNQVKLLKIDINDCSVQTLYKEADHKLEDFFIQQDMLLIVIKNNQTNHYQIKIYKFGKGFIAKYQGQIDINDEKVGNNLQTVELLQNNMIPSGNDVFMITKEHKKYKFNKYLNVIPINKEQGDCLLFNSPLVSQLYRKMVYFISNKSQLKPKTGIVIPYLNDNYSTFNRRETLSQYTQFYEYSNIRTCQHETDILVFIPFSQLLLRYNLKCQLIQSFRLNQIFEQHGEQTLAVSQNGKFFVQRSEENANENVLSIVSFQIKQEITETVTVRQSNNFKTQQSPSFDKPEMLSRPQSNNSYKLNTPSAREALQKRRIQAVDSYLDITCEETINLYGIGLEDLEYQKQRIFSVGELIDFYRERGCDMTIKINDNLDIVIGLVYYKRKEHKEKHQQSCQLKDMILLKKVDNVRRAFRIFMDIKIDKDMSIAYSEKDVLDPLKYKLLKDFQSFTEKQKSLNNGDISQFNNLDNCSNFIITNDKLIVWSKTKFYIGDLAINSNNNNEIITLKQSLFRIKENDDCYIESITSHGATEESLSDNNYYVYIKINMEHKYAFYVKYNILKNKEYAAFDCKLNSEVFFDHNMDGYILNEDSIVDIDQGVPLYFYKTGMSKFDKKYLLGNSIDRGLRFCQENIHFMVRNRYYLPYSYFVFIMKDNNPGRLVDNLTFDVQTYFYYNGQTLLHQVANSYQDLEYLLNQYDQTNPKLKNMLLLKNERNQNVLQVALANENQRCVNLILHHLSDLQMNNIHQLKDSFSELLDYNAFENYLDLCFFQTDQMKKKVVFQRKSKYALDQSYIQSHNQSFLDQAFYNKFEDKRNLTKPVIVRTMDAGWLLKDKIGIEFLLKLSESENMNYFGSDTVKILVKYQWQRIKPMIIKYLFVPFLLNMIIYSVYSVYIFELVRTKITKTIIDDQGNEKEVTKTIIDEDYFVLNLAFQISILLFTVFTFFVELQQIKFHQREYLKSFWNILDLITVIMAPLTVIMDLTYLEDYEIRPYMAICNLTFFIRFFYFLRIFDKTAHLIRTIVEITVDIFDFLFVFYLGIIGFGLSFYILSNNNEADDDKFIKSFASSFMYSYRLSLGDFQLDPFETSRDGYLIWVLFVICSMTTAIILLNMLVAIMGESFSRVIENSENQRVREHLQLMVENDFLLSNRKKFFKDVKYLIEVKDEVQVTNQDPLANLIETIDEKNSTRDMEVKTQMEEMRNLIKHQSEQIQNLLSVKSEISSLHKLINDKFADDEKTQKSTHVMSLQEKLEQTLATQLNLKELMQL